MTETKRQSGRLSFLSSLGIKAILIFSLLLTGCNSKTPSQLVSEAEEHVRQGNIQVAIIQLRSILEENISFLAALNVLNGIYAEREQYEDIIYLLARAEKEGVDDEGILLSLTDALIHEGKFEQALSVFKNHPTKFSSAHGLSLIGHCYAGLNRSNQAREHFQRALKLDKDLISAHIGLAQEEIITAEKSRRNASLVEAQAGAGEVTQQKNKNAWVVKDQSESSNTEPANKASYNEEKILSTYEKEILNAKKHLEQVIQLEKNNVTARYLLASIDYLQKRYKPAKEMLDKLLIAVPKHKESLYLSGKLYLEDGQLEKGKERLQRYIKLAPDDLKANMYLASIMLRQKEADQSIKLLETLSAQGESDPEYLLLMGNAYLYKQDNPKALKYFNDAYEILPGSLLVKIYLAMGYLANDERTQAIILLEKVIEQEPENKQALLSLTTTLLQVEEYQKAKNVVSKFIQYYPREPVPYYLSGMVDESMGNENVAIESYKKALQLNHSFIAVTLRLAALYQRQGDEGAALRQYEEGLFTTPYNPEILVEMAIFEQGRGNNKRFIEYLELARDRNPEAVTSRLLLGSYYLRAGRVSESQAILKELQRTPSAMSDIQLFLGQVKLATGQYADAAKIFSSLIVVEPDSPELLTNYGSAMVKSGRRKEGIKALQAALGLSGRTYPEALFEYGQALISEGRINKAVDIANELLEKFSDLPVGNNLLGDISRLRKDYPQAILSYKQALDKSNRTQFVLKLLSAYRQSGQEDKAHDLLTQSVENNPDNIRLSMTYASLKLAEGEPQVAMALYHDLLNTYPDNALILNNLAWMYDNHDRKKALALAERAYQVTPELPEIIDTYGWFCILEGRLTEGLNLLEIAVNKSPSDPEFRYHLAEALNKTGETSSARESLELALASEEKFNGRSAAEALFQKLSREN